MRFFPLSRCCHSCRQLDLYDEPANCMHEAAVVNTMSPKALDWSYSISSPWRGCLHPPWQVPHAQTYIGYLSFPSVLS